MCEFATYNEKGQLICEPKKDLCLLCVRGNGRRYMEIKTQKDYFFKMLSELGQEEI